MRVGTSPLSLSLSFQQQSLSGETMDPTLVSGIWFESQFQICVYEHAILRIYIKVIFFYQLAHQGWSKPPHSSLKCNIDALVISKQ